MEARMRLKPAFMTISKIGIDSSRPIVALVAKIVTAIVHADKNGNGKIDSTERIALLGFLSMEFYLSLNGLPLKQVGDELADLDAKEIAELVNVFSMNHDLKDDVLESLIEDTLKWLVDGISLIGGFRKWRETRQGTGTAFPSLPRLAALNQLNVAYSPSN